MENVENMESVESVENMENVETALARLMGMRFQGCSRIERGERAPTLQQAAFIRYIEAHPPTAEEIEALRRKEP